MRRSWRRRMRQAILLLFCGALLLIGASGWVWLAGRSFIQTAETAPEAQTAIVLGALVYPDGRVSPMVADRLEATYQLYRLGKVRRVLITGDHGQVEYDEVNTMRRYLEAKGVPPAEIFMDHAGFDTYDSLYRARAVFQVQSALVVTQGFHLPRALYIARRLGLQAHGVAADRFIYQDASYYEVREAAARVKAFGEVLLRRKPHFLGPVIPITGDGRETHDQPR